jgi:hypothetical protein
MSFDFLKFCDCFFSLIQNFISLAGSLVAITLRYLGYGTYLQTAKSFAKIALLAQLHTDFTHQRRVISLRQLGMVPAVLRIRDPAPFLPQDPK